MTAQTSAERQAALHQRRTEAGLKELRNFWAHPDDEAAIREFAASRTKTRRALGRLEKLKER